MRIALAHDGLVHAARLELWTAWTLDPYVLAPLAAAAFLYFRGTSLSWRRAGRGRGVRTWEAASFAGGLAALFVALVWPLDALGEALFSAHMAQHLVLMNLAAPLLVLGAPLQVMIRALPPGARRSLAALAGTRAWRGAWVAASGLVAATLLQQVALWSWHTPRGVALALESDPIHIAMHASLAAAALLFWTAVLRPRARHYWGSIAAVLVTLKTSGIVAILLLLQPGAIYGVYGSSALAWGLAPHEDEQLGWGLMMVAGSATYLAAGLALVARALFPGVTPGRPASARPA